MAITTFAQLMEEARGVGPKTVAIAAAQDATLSFSLEPKGQINVRIQRIAKGQSMSPGRKGK